MATIETKSFPLSALSRTQLALLVLLFADVARAEASHHQAGAAAGQVAGQVAGMTSAAQAQSFASGVAEDWQFRLFPTYLRASHAFDDGGTAVAMPAGTRVENYTLNAYAERRLGERWAFSGLTGWQLLDLRESGASRRVASLADSFLALRRTDPRSWGALSAVGTVKIPGTYPETTLTSTKQVDGQLEVLASLQPLRWLGIVGGGGYRLRLGDVKDEITATVLVPVALGRSVTLTPTVLGAFAVGFGSVAKTALTPGASLGGRIGNVDLSAGYYRTIYGRNVTQSDVLMLGAGLSL
jgi:hypothetical protein